MAVSHEREGLSSAVTIPRIIKILSEGFDPVWRLLLFCESANLCALPTGRAQLSNLARDSLE